MTTALQIAEGIPGPIVVLDQTVVERTVSLAERAQLLGPITLANMSQADAVLREASALAKQVEAQRKAVKAPILELGKAVDVAAAKVGDALGQITRRLTKAIGDVQLAEKRREEAAEAKRRRVEAATLAREAELAALAQTAAPEERATVEALRHEAHEQSAREWLASTELGPALPKTSVHLREVLELEIYDLKSIPLEVNGIPLIAPERPAIMRLLKAGITIPGARLVPVQRAARNSR